MRKQAKNYFASTQSPPPHACLRPLQQIPARPRDFDSKFPSALLDIKQNQTGGLDAGGIHWRILASHSGAILAGYLAGSTGKGYSAGSGELLWWDTRRDPLASHSGTLSGWDTRQDPLAGGILGGILGGIHWRAALAGYSDKFFAR